MPSSNILRLVALVGTDVSEEPSASIIRGTRIGELGTTLFPPSVRRLLVTANVVPGLPICTLMMGALRSFETSVLIRATQNHLQTVFFIDTEVKTSTLT
jgi:hypothetical protein